MIVLSFEDNEKTLFEKVLSVPGNEMPFERTDPISVHVLSYPGLEIRQHQRRVLRDGSDIYLTRLEYGTLVYLASYPGMVLSQEQIFEAVWSMDSDSCQSSVVNVIYNLRKKLSRTSKTQLT